MRDRNRPPRIAIATLSTLIATGVMAQPYAWTSNYTDQGLKSWGDVQCGGQDNRCPCDGSGPIYWFANGDTTTKWHAGSCQTHPTSGATSYNTSISRSLSASSYTAAIAGDPTPPQEGSFQLVMSPTLGGNVLQAQVRYLDLFGGAPWTRNEAEYAIDGSGNFKYYQEGDERYYSFSIYLRNGNDQTGQSSTFASWSCTDYCSSANPGTCTPDQQNLIGYYPQGWQNCPGGSPTPGDNGIPNTSYSPWTVLTQVHPLWGRPGLPPTTCSVDSDCGSYALCQNSICQMPNDDAYGLNVVLVRSTQTSNKYRLVLQGPAVPLSSDNTEMWRDGVTTNLDHSVMLNTWYRFVLWVHWSAYGPRYVGDTTGGIVKLWVNGASQSLTCPNDTNSWYDSNYNACYTRTLDYRGITGQGSNANAVLKQGIYRNPTLKEAVSVYYSDVQDVSQNPSYASSDADCGVGYVAQGAYGGCMSADLGDKYFNLQQSVPFNGNDSSTWTTITQLNLAPLGVYPNGTARNTEFIFPYWFTSSAPSVMALDVSVATNSGIVAQINGTTSGSNIFDLVTTTPMPAGTSPVYLQVRPRLISGPAGPVQLYGSWYSPGPTHFRVKAH